MKYYAVLGTHTEFMEWVDRHMEKNDVFDKTRCELHTAYDRSKSLEAASVYVWISERGGYDSVRGIELAGYKVLSCRRYSLTELVKSRVRA